MSPWRQKYLTTRRHPLAMTSYACTLVLGIVFTFNILETTSLPGVRPLWDWAWKLMLDTGGLFGVVALLTKPRLSPKWPDLADLLHIEAIAAFVSGLGFIVYAVSITNLVHHLAGSVAVLFVMGAGMLWRSVQARSEAKKAEYLARVYDDAHRQMLEIEQSADEVTGIEGHHLDGHDYEG